MHLQELKDKSPAELLAFAEEREVENASTLRTQDMMFAILKNLADSDVTIRGAGVLEVLSDGFGFCAHLNQIIWRGLMIFTCHHHRLNVLVCAQVIR